ncbi:MAG: hypothetical protein C3F11_00155 [Methylocystaceae bacterium]|nr:MAG: hypothetical protein C3F11_00155 [Methylocystaceae bacterium]
MLSGECLAGSRSIVETAAHPQGGDEAVPISFDLEHGERLRLDIFDSSREAVAGLPVKRRSRDAGSVPRRQPRLHP